MKTSCGAQPNPNKLFAAIDILLIPSSLFMVGFVIYMARMVLRQEVIGIVFMFVFASAALYYLLGRFIVKHKRKKKTIYVLTDKRAIEIIAGRSRKVKSIYYSQIDELKHTCNKKGEAGYPLRKATCLELCMQTSVWIYLCLRVDFRCFMT